MEASDLLTITSQDKKEVITLLKAQNFNESRNKQNVKEFIIISFNRSKDWAEATDISHFWSYVARQTHLLLRTANLINTCTNSWCDVRKLSKCVPFGNFRLMFTSHSPRGATSQS